MANSRDPEVTSTPAPAPAPAAPAEQKREQQPQKPQQQDSSTNNAKGMNGAQKPTKQPKPADASAEGGAVGGSTEKPLSGAELKKRAKAEKAARRAREKLEREKAGAAAALQQQHGQAPSPAKKGQQGGKDAAAAQKGQKQLPIRRGSAQAAAAGSVEQKEDKRVAVFGHLYGQQRRSTIAGAGKEVHPAVLALGLQMRDYVVCGSSARCVATLLAFKRV